MSEEVNDSAEQQAIRRQARQWVVRLASHAADADDALAFRRWCERSRDHASAFVQARAVWQDLRPAAQHVQRAEVARAAQRDAGRFGRRAFLGAALAGTAAWAVVRPPLGLWPALGDLAADLRTGTGEQREWVTPEGIVVQLNTRTRMDLRAAEGGVARLELLEGEAEIRTDLDGAAPAVQVRAGDGLITAQRARFNVRFIDGEVCVTCLAGRVDVRRGEAASTAVDVDRQLLYARARPGVARPADAAAVSAWRRRQLVFDQTPLAEVVAEVNRYRPGKLILTSTEIGRKRVQASFSIDRLDDVIALVREVYRLDVTTLPGGIVLLGSA
ncbi:FecR family protein [Variovorax boronicumulans]|uniref:FecR family protein n=1 Tax=Variovorax boronicumulans TaxID=436515 RepID=UPI001C574B88